MNIKILIDKLMKLNPQLEVYSYDRFGELAPIMLIEHDSTHVLLTASFGEEEKKNNDVWE